MTQRFPRPSQRDTWLTERHNLKMAKSAHAYMRGNTVQYYEWLDSAASRLPQGPPLWICGDCHLGNIGPIADAKGNIDVQIRDLDQTVIGNPAHDLVRLSLSLAMVARGSDLPGVVTAKMMEQLTLGYEQALRGKAGKQQSTQERPDVIKLVMRRAMRRKWKHLTADRIEGTDPNIPLSKSYWPLSIAERKELKALMDADGVRRLATLLSHRTNEADVAMIDAAYWVKGCSSLGRLRYAILLRVGGSKNPERSLCLIDVKEASRAVAPVVGKGSMPRDNGQRIVEGTRHLSPNLGGRMLAGHVLGRSVFIRELLPQDLKVDIEHLAPKEAMAVAGYLGNVLGQAHARQLAEEARAQWSRELGRYRPKTIDTPSWLWQSMVELVQLHEGGYLEHCRRFAQLLT